MSQNTDGEFGGQAATDGIVADWASRTPAATAVAAGDGRFTYAEVAEHTARLTARLRARGVGPDVPVALHLGRTRWLVPSLLAVWSAGGTAVPIDDRHPSERNAFVLRDARAEVAITDRAIGDIAPRGLAVLHPDLDSQPGRDSNRADGSMVSAAATDPYDCAYVIYTSGTSGWPKGVEVTYGGLASFLDAVGELRLEAGGMGINAVSPAFDGWLWCTLLALTHGQGVTLLDGATAGDGDLGAAIAAAGATTVCLTPSLLAACADDLPGVRTLVVAGEAAPPGLLDRFRGDRRILNVYGPTEATIAATWADSARGDDVTTIGRPLPRFRAYVLDDDQRPVAPGTVGELHLAGPALARGYRGRPGRTAASFVVDPFVDSGERMYRTGDLVVLRDDGQLDYRGRRDAQVKVRGVRVELSEIEQVAAASDGVGVAAAYVNAAGDAVELAVVAAEVADAGGVSGDDLPTRVRTRCAEQLPAAMVPVAVHVVASLPTTPTGKVDRDALAQLATAVSAGRAAATPHEQDVCDVFSELLPRPVNGVDVDFFASGGHSLLATRAVSALRRVTGLRVRVQDLLSNPTPAGLAGVLDDLAAQNRPATGAQPVQEGVS